MSGPIPMFVIREYASKFAAVLLSLAGIVALVQKSPHILSFDLQAGVKSGLSGAAAGFLQVFAFMWLRTVLNVQYANGGDFFSVLRKLWKEGGIPRFYRGCFMALLQNPAVRFGDTFTNSVGLRYFEGKKSSLLFQTALSTLFASLWRLVLTPLDFLKTNMQVHGIPGFKLALDRRKREGFFIFWSGGTAILLANWAGSYPWFSTYNTLQLHIPKFSDSSLGTNFREAVIGCCSSFVSDISTNCIRVVKTISQSRKDTGYQKALTLVLNDYGCSELFTRGLKTRMAINAAQSMFFTVMWKHFERGNLEARENKYAVLRKNHKIIPGRNVVWRLSCPLVSPDVYLKRDLNSDEVLSHMIRRLESVDPLIEPFQIQPLCGIIPQVLYDAIVFPTRDEMFGSITTLIKEHGRCYSKAQQSLCEDIHRVRCANVDFLHKSNVTSADLGVKTSRSKHPCYCQSELHALLYGKEGDVIPEVIKDVRYNPLNSKRVVRTMPSRSVRSLRMMHESLFAESFEKTLFKKLGLTYYGRNAYSRNARFFHESYLEFTSNQGDIHSDGIFLVTLQLYFPNEANSKDYLGTCFHNVDSNAAPEREVHGHIMRVNKSECTYKNAYVANTGYAFAASKSSFHSSPDVCEGVCCPFSRQSVIYNWKKSESYMKKRIEHEKRVLTPNAINMINYFTKQPKIGFGTAQDMHTRAKSVSTYVIDAFSAGFRHVDTSNYYGTERSVGEGIKSAGLERNEIFVTAKYMPDRKICEMDYDSTFKAFNKTISQLGVEYVDLYLVHIPGFTYAQLQKCESNVQNFNSKLTNKIRRREVWRAMEILHDEGRVLALGVSNFSPEHLDDILEVARVLPVMNQIEFNPFYHNEDWWTHNMANGVMLTSFSSARKFLKESPSSPRRKLFEELAYKYKKSPVQVFQRWVIERRVNIITASTSKEHQLENLAILDFELDKADILRISGLRQDKERGLHLRVS